MVQGSVQVSTQAGVCLLGLNEPLLDLLLTFHRLGAALPLNGLGPTMGLQFNTGCSVLYRFIGCGGGGKPVHLPAKAGNLGPKLIRLRHCLVKSVLTLGKVSRQTPVFRLQSGDLLFQLRPKLPLLRTGLLLPLQLLLKLRHLSGVLLSAALQIIHHVLLLKASKSRRAELKSIFIHGVFLLKSLIG